MERPGWVRMSIHPIMTNEEVDYICDAIKQVSEHFKLWGEDYEYDDLKNEFIHKNNPTVEKEITQNWFDL